MVRVVGIALLLLVVLTPMACTSAKMAQDIIVRGMETLRGQAAQVAGDGTLVNPGFEWGFRAGMFNGPDASGYIRLTGTTAKISGSMNAAASQPTTQPAAGGP